VPGGRTLQIWRLSTVNQHKKNQPKFHKVNKNSKNSDQFIAKKSNLVKSKPEYLNFAQLIQQPAGDLLCFSPYQKPVKLVLHS
jgi:hypothetical protein